MRCVIIRGKLRCDNVTSYEPCHELRALSLVMANLRVELRAELRVGLQAMSRVELRAEFQLRFELRAELRTECGPSPRLFIRVYSLR